MHIGEGVVVIFSAVMLLPMLSYAWRSVTACRRHTLLMEECAGCCEEVGFVGCSVVCYAEYDVVRLQSLMAVEYHRYELIAVVDSSQHKAEVEHIVTHFRLIKVNCPLADGSEALYRSRQREFNRLVVLDRRGGMLYDGLNGAMAVASYDYLLPVGRGVRLFPHAIEALMVAVSEEDDFVEALVVKSLPGTYLFNRDAVAAAGGFSADVVAYRSFATAAAIYAPVVYRSEGGSGLFWTVYCGLGMVLAVVVYLAFGTLAAMVLVMSEVALLAVAQYQRELFRGGNSLKVTLLCYFNHIVSFFYCRKFHL